MTNKTVLCFGDSNTWGYTPIGESRYDSTTRWTGVLQSELGDRFKVIEEGLCGRTTVWEDPVSGDKSGCTQLPSILLSHSPLDLVIIMLGTNDLKNRFSVSPLDVCRSIGRLVGLTQIKQDLCYGARPEVLVICPPPFADMSQSPFGEMFIGGSEKSTQLGTVMKKYCSEQNIRLLDAGEHITSSKLDGIHLDASEHAKLGKIISKEVISILGSNN